MNIKDEFNSMISISAINWSKLREVLNDLYQVIISILPSIQDGKIKSILFGISVLIEMIIDIIPGLH